MEFSAAAEERRSPRETTTRVFQTRCAHQIGRLNLQRHSNQAPRSLCVCACVCVSLSHVSLPISLILPSLFSIFPCFLLDSSGEHMQILKQNARRTVCSRILGLARNFVSQVRSELPCSGRTLQVRTELFLLHSRPWIR